MKQKWHVTKNEKPATDTVVVGYWVNDDDEVFVGACYLDDMGHWYLAEDEPGADTSYKQPRYWIEDPIKR